MRAERVPHGLLCEARGATYKLALMAHKVLCLNDKAPLCLIVAFLQSKDVVNFLTWATEPTCDERKLFGLKAVSAAILGCALMTVWWRFFWVIYATRRIDFGKLKYL